MKINKLNEDYKQLKKATNINTIKERITDIVRDYMEGIGFEDDDVDKYFVVEHKVLEGAVKIEVRAELGFDDMRGLMKILDPIVEAIDDTAYFENEDVGIINAFVDKNVILGLNEEILDEDEFEEAIDLTPSVEAGLSSMLNDAIQNTLATIDNFNSIAITANDESHEDIANVVKGIVVEQNKQVGKLQELLKLVSPAAKAIEQGKAEVEEQVNSQESINVEDDISELELEEAISTIEKLRNEDNNSTTTPNNISIENEEEVVPMRESWEDIYDSFKKIENNLNDDGEAITATIDRIYQENKSNPDFKKAYDKWASGN